MSGKSKGAVFERHEKKFKLDAPRFEALLTDLESEMQQDIYGLHTICSIYYDTEDYSLIRNSLDKPIFREKLRLRSYGVPRKQDNVYLELKKKFDGITHKRRIALPLQQALDYLNLGDMPENQNQIFGEIHWFMSRRKLKPRVMICYDRIALFAKEDPNLRITFDTNIRWRDYCLNLSLGDYGSQLLLPGTHIMEIKTLKSIPMWLCEKLSTHCIYPTSFSKYGTIYRECLCCRKEYRNVI